MNKIEIPVHAVTFPYPGIANRIITFAMVSDAFDPTKQENQQVTPYQTKALWDTGATKSVITKATT